MGKYFNHKLTEKEKQKSEALARRYYVPIDRLASEVGEYLNNPKMHDKKNGPSGILGQLSRLDNFTL